MAQSLATLARLLRAIDDGDPDALALARHGRARRRQTPVLALSGPAGAGKSTLLAALVAVLRRRTLRVAVLAVDPSSPRSGGALLGDRLRLGGLTDDPDVLFRSLATRGSNGGLSLSVDASIDALCGAEYDVVLIETVGVGQSEVDVEAIADAVAIVLAPGQGDDIQAMKAGLLEIADVLVVNKAELGGADRLVADLQTMRALTHDGRSVPIVQTSAIKRLGAEDVCNALLDAAAGRKLRTERAQRDAIARRAGERSRELVARWLQTDEGRAILATVQSGEMALDDAADGALRLLAKQLATASAAPSPSGS